MYTTGCFQPFKINVTNKTMIYTSGYFQVMYHLAKSSRVLDVNDGSAVVCGVT